MANTTIDTIDLEVTVNSKKATSNLKETTTQVDKLIRTMTTHKDGILQTETEYKKVGNEIEQVIRKYNKLGEVISTITKSGITQKEVAPKLPKTPEDFTKTYKNIVDGATKSETVYSRIAGEIKKVTTYYNDENFAIKRVSEEVDKLGNKTISTQNLEQKEVQETKNWYQRLFDTIKKGGRKSGSGGIAKSLNFGALVGKLYFVRNITKRLSDTLANVVQYGIDFTETLNLWQTAMRGNVGEARTFISEMNKAYGIAEATLMKYQATFKNMLSAMGKISEDTAYGLSEALTNMAIDFASLYNVNIESAMTKFQAVLSGQVRPIRSISGYDITENTIFDIYKGLGGTKTMRQLDQTEKRLLRIYAVFTQMSGTGALGDLQKTLATNANQLRIMKEQAIEFATWIGNGISYLIQESGILVKLNSYLFTAKELAKSLAYELGYSEENFISGIFDSAEQANDEIDELQGKLLGFDKFQSLQDSGTGDISIESALTEALKNYQSLLSGVVNPAQEASVKILEAMGMKLVDIVDNETGAVVQVWKFVDGTTSLLEKVKEIAGAISGIVGIISLISHPILTIFTAVEAYIIKNKELREQILKLINSVIPAIKGIGIMLFDIIKEIMPVFVDLAMAIIELVKPILPLLKMIVEFFVNIIKLFSPILKMIAQTLSSLSGIVAIVSKLLEGITWLTSKIFTLGAYVMTALVAPFELLLKIVQTIGAVLNSIATLDFGSLGSKLSNIWGKWNIGSYVASIPRFENGGVPDKGSLFLAGEAGAELVTSTSGGSAVMNMEQLQTAITRGMLVAMASNETEQTQNININVGSQNWFNITRKVAQQNGYDLVKVR